MRSEQLWDSVPQKPSARRLGLQPVRPAVCRICWPCHEPESSLSHLRRGGGRGRGRALSPRARAARTALSDRRWLPAHTLPGSVISVGNLSVGGSGKTPFVILLGELLKARGIGFDVLSRGYGRRTRGVLQVDPGGLPRDFGDEPLLIARRLQAPVVVGEDRYEAGRFAEARFGAQIHLLDDGFQHRALARDFDIVLVTPEDARD